MYSVYKSVVMMLYAKTMKRGDVVQVTNSTPDLLILSPLTPLDCESTDLIFESSLSTSISEDDSMFTDALEDFVVVKSLFSVVGAAPVRSTTMHMRQGGGTRKPVKVKAISAAKRKIVSLK